MGPLGGSGCWIGAGGFLILSLLCGCLSGGGEFLDCEGLQLTYRRVGVLGDERRVVPVTRLRRLLVEISVRPVDFLGQGVAVRRDLSAQLPIRSPQNLKRRQCGIVRVVDAHGKHGDARRGEGTPVPDPMTVISIAVRCCTVAFSIQLFIICGECQEG